MDPIIYSFEQPERLWISFDDLNIIERAMTGVVLEIYKESGSKNLNKWLVKALGGSALFSES